MRRDDRVFVLGEEVAEYQGAYRVTEGLLQEFGEWRVRDTPISEEAIAGVGTGAAMVGLRPVAEMMTMNFAMLALDQIVNHAAKLRYMSGGQLTIPLVIRGPAGGGMQLGAQHSQLLESWYAHIPGLKVVMPSYPSDAKGLLKASIRDDNPVIFIEHALLYTMKGPVPEGEYIVPLGKADVKREGTDITLIAYSRMVYEALEAAQLLESQGISAEVVDPRTMRPLDIETIANSVKKTGRVAIIQEDWQMASMSSEIAAQVMEHAFDYLDSPVLRISSADTPMPYARDLEQAAIPKSERIAQAVKKLL
jgi:pyruvate dehydrogenase E1 component beta subunit